MQMIHAGLTHPSMSLNEGGFYANNSNLTVWTICNKWDQAKHFFGFSHLNSMYTSITLWHKIDVI